MTKSARTVEASGKETVDLRTYGAEALQFIGMLDGIRERVAVTDGAGKALSLEKGLTAAITRMIACCKRGNQL